MIRTIVFWLHLSVASAAGTVVFMLAATGVILSLEETALGLAERRYRVEAPDGSVRLPPEAIVRAAGLAATSLHYASDPRAAVRVYEGRDRFARVDPCTGQVLGIGPGGLERFFEDVRAWHRWFNLSGSSVRKGRAVTGAVNAAFLFLLLTGPILWIPRPISKRSLAAWTPPAAGGERRPPQPQLAPGGGDLVGPAPRGDRGKRRDHLLPLGGRPARPGGRASGAGGGVARRD